MWTKKRTTVTKCARVDFCIHYSRIGLLYLAYVDKVQHEKGCLWKKRSKNAIVFRSFTRVSVFSWPQHTQRSPLTCGKLGQNSYIVYINKFRKTNIIHVFWIDLRTNVTKRLWFLKDISSATTSCQSETLLVMINFKPLVSSILFLGR